MMIYFVLLFLIFLWKFSDIHKGWLIFVALITVLAESGLSISTVKLLLAIGLAKFCIDFYDAGK